MIQNQESSGIAAAHIAADYLRSSGIRLPDFEITCEPPEGRLPIGGSCVDGYGRFLRLNMGRYPTAFLRNWFAMHELGHILWETHKPLRWKRFREEFGEPRPRDYIELHRKHSWKTAGSWRLSWFPGPQRPPGQPSWYGACAGGEERFCELLGLMHAHGDFSQDPPDDLSDLWECCWNEGLARMT